MVIHHNTPSTNQKIETQVNEMSGKTKEANDAFTQQAASLEEIAATIQNLNADMKVIENYIKQLI